MPTQSVNSLAIGQDARIAAHVVRAEILFTKNQTPYLSLTLEDRSGAIPAVRFNPTESECAKLSDLKFAMAAGKVQEYRARPQLVLDAPLEDLGIPDDLTPYLPSSPVPLPELERRLLRRVDSVEHTLLHSLLRAVLYEDKKVAKRFRELPAALDRHHAYRHGLLQHTLEVTDLVAAVTTQQANWGYLPLDLDLAITGALLHDIGKVEEITVRDFGYRFSNPGALLGHITLGAILVARKIAGVRKLERGFPDELEQKLLHLITSHHGKGEWGSPTSPMFPEAAILHIADCTSAELFYMAEARSQAVPGEAFVKQRKLDSGFGSQGRYVLVGNSGAASSASEPADNSRPAASGPGLPILHVIAYSSHDATRPRGIALPILGSIAAGKPLLTLDGSDSEALVEADGISCENHYLL
ncbi:MAG TPA: HD domain-containing protein, partial [Chthonomonadales bacterium]|nr:HD domain-containing protein [Chthonomonadales bacterium]